jgi:hypothetical protein
MFVSKSEVPINEASQDLLLMLLLVGVYLRFRWTKPFKIHTWCCFVVFSKSEVPINEASQDLLLMFLLSARPCNQPGQRCCCCVLLLVLWICGSDVRFLVIIHGLCCSWPYWSSPANVFRRHKFCYGVFLEVFHGCSPCIEHVAMIFGFFNRSVRLTLFLACWW